MELTFEKETSLSQNEYYKNLTQRNGSFVNEEVQKKLKNAKFLIAGCGSTGGASVEPLVRLGATKFILADNGEYELNNLNRQSAFINDIDRNKAEVMKERILSVNPFSEVTVFNAGINKENVMRCVQESTIIIDGVDVTERSGWEAKWLLHEMASKYQKPVITGWDIGSIQYVQFFDYSNISYPFNKKITYNDLDNLELFRLLYKLLPVSSISLDMLNDIELNWKRKDYSLPQIVYTSLLFGAISSRLVIDILSNNQLKKDALIDLQKTFMNKRKRINLSIKKYQKLFSLLKQL